MIIEILTTIIQITRIEQKFLVWNIIINNISNAKKY